MSHAIVLGAGPSGLAAAHELCNHGASVVVIEKMERVGGLARTVPHDGCLYDIGPHRFYTKNAEVLQLYVRTLREDLVRVPRRTRIYYGNKFFNYPLTPFNALRGLGISFSIAVLLSYLHATIRRSFCHQVPQTFEEWITTHFGARLYQTFFKTYTEKVWGIPCSQIGADWAAQRIKNLNLAQAIKHAFFKPSGTRIKTLADEFLFPRRGAGMFYEKLAAGLRGKGGHLILETPVVRIRREGTLIRSVIVREPDGSFREFEAEHFLSSIPITTLVELMDLPAPDEVRAACKGLRYRDHLAVNLKIAGQLFPDNWIYIHSKEVLMARVTNYRNFSRDMTDAENVSPITVEYFAFHGDQLWSRSDRELVRLASQELQRIGLVQTQQIHSGFVIRDEKAYPVLETGFHEAIGTVKAWLDEFKNLHPIGRTGMFKYNNQDHAIATGLLAARNALGIGRFDPWVVNIDAEYLEGSPALAHRE